MARPARPGGAAWAGRLSWRTGLAATLAALAVLPVVAEAHPHMWIDGSARLQFDDQGRLTALRQTWLFDEMFASYALLGVPKTAAGGYAPEVLAPLALEWMEALSVPQTHYFSGLRQGGGDAPRLPFGQWRDATLDWHADSGRISLTFEVPLAKPVAVGGKPVRVDIFDPTYYVAYDFSAPGAITLAGAPAACSQAYHPPRELDWQTMAKLAELPQDVDSLPEELFAITRSLSHRIEIRCP